MSEEKRKYVSPIDHFHKWELFSEYVFDDVECSIYRCRLCKEWHEPLVTGPLPWYKRRKDLNLPPE